MRKRDDDDDNSDNDDYNVMMRQLYSVFFSSCRLGDPSINFTAGRQAGQLR